MLRTRGLFIGVLLLGAVPKAVEAQTVAAITGYEVQVLIAATNTTVTKQVPVSAVTCNLAPTAIPTGTLVNPTTVEFADAAVAGQVCRFSVGNFFSTLPVNTGYNATITALSALAPSDRSLPSNPFDVAPVRPAARTGVGVRP